MTDLAIGLRSDSTALTVLLAVLAPDDGRETTTTEPDAASRLDRLARLRPRRSSPGADQWVVLPTRTRPRYLLPVSPTRTAAAVRLRASDRPLTRMAGASLSLVLRAGIGSVLPNRVVVPRGSDERPSLMSWLQTRLDQPQIAAAIGIGAPRPNRKPVLQLIDGRGTTVGYGKVGVDAHTNGLVTHEARFLAGIERTNPLLVIPSVLVLDDWKGHTVLVVGDLGPGLEASADLHLTAEAIEAIADLGPRAEHAVLDSPWWQRTGERIGKLTGPDRRLLERCHRVVGPRLGDWRWSFGTWHGDLAPWNARWRDGVLYVWDWERAGGPVPVGFDAVHAHFQVGLLRRRHQARDAADAVVADRSGLLADLGYERTAASALVLAYLLELRLRMAEDAARGSLGVVSWVADAVGSAIMDGHR